MMTRTVHYKIEMHSDILSFLKGKEHYSAHQITQLRKTENGILVNGKHARTIDSLYPGDVLSVNIPLGESEIEPVDLPLEVVYEDEDVLVVNKEAFRVCHPTRNHQGDSLANAVAFYLQKKGKTCTFRAINRLDRDTTGLVVIALHRTAAGRVRESLQKTYFALVTGTVETDGTIDLPIKRVDERHILRCVHPEGERAVTHYRVLEHRPGATLLEIDLETGRTHQIRVHFSHLGHPLVGDTMYGEASPDINHQCLHCGRVVFEQPFTKKRIELSALPDWY